MFVATAVILSSSSSILSYSYASTYGPLLILSVLMLLVAVESAVLHSMDSQSTVLLLW